GLMQLRFSGRLKRTHATPSRTVCATVSVSDFDAASFALAIGLTVHLDRELPRLTFNGDPAQLGELVHASLAAEAAVARSANTAERLLRLVMSGWAVDVTHAGADLTRNAQSTRDVSRKHRRGQAVRAVIGDPDCLDLILRTNDADNWTETLVS